VQIRWFNNLPKQDQDKFKQEVLNSKKVLDKLLEIVYNMRVESRTNDYDSPSWAFKQADMNGYNRALEEIATLIKIEEVT